MQYKLGLRGETFTPAVEAFDTLMLQTLQKMRKQKISEGAVTLKIAIALTEEYPIGEDGEKREVFVPVFEHEVSAQIVQKNKVKGRIAEDFVLEAGAGGQLRLLSRDQNTLFDIIEEAEKMDRESGDETDGGV